MKTKILFLSWAFIVTLVSCNKNEITKSHSKEEIENAKRNAKEISKGHDSLLLEMINYEKQLVIQKVKSEGSKEITLNIKDALDIIEKVTGVHPYVLDNKSKIRQLTESSENNNSILSVNLDAEKINLSEYGNSALLKDYLKKVDNVLSDSTTNNSQKSLQINNLQNEISQNSEVSIVDIEQFYKVTEILKGSMTLWTNEYPINKVKYNSTNKYLIKEPCKWKNWQKVLFISVADAVGGVVCTGTGSMMIINGVPVYVPPGAAGTIIGAAAISFIVSRICYP